ncbi:hypothetical protein PEC106664_07020 [Pectobacterium carotovorum subsp. carotovorum]|nr:hypothetical protein PEC106664_07020 [Pectobacterium carotovorum subsp. carotovorum]
MTHPSIPRSPQLTTPIESVSDIHAEVRESQEQETGK